MTPEREQKFSDVLKKRQANITVVLENVHDPHNISAVLRTCDAVGIPEIYVLNTVVEKPKKYGKKSSSSANKWVDVLFYNDVKKCLSEVKEKYKTIYATALGRDAKGLFNLDLTDSFAFLFGNEKEGLSEEIRQYADANFIIPQVGMIPSLNISVACAVSLYEAFRQREAKGYYDEIHLPPEKSDAIYKKWIDREIRKR